MGVVRDAVLTENDDVIALDQVLGIGSRDCGPGLTAVEGDVMITAGAWLRRPAGLKRSRDHVVRVGGIDRDRYFSGIDRVRRTDAYHLLRLGRGGEKQRQV